MMNFIKQIIITSLISLVCCTAQARETIVILSSSSPAHSGTPHTLALINTANKIQDKYQFVLEFKPGGFESIAMKQVSTDPQHYLSTHTNTIAESVDRKFVDISNYVPVFSQGDFCWAAIALVGPKGKDLTAIKNLDEITVGTPALGGATHMLALEIGKKFNIPVRYVLFQSNFDAFTNMVSNNGVTFVVERISNYNQYRDKNPNIKALAVLCPVRHPAMPDIKTTSEQGITVPYIWQIIFASKDMDITRRKEIANIFEQAEKQIGQQEIFKLSDQVPPIFNGITTEQHFIESWKQLNNARKKWRSTFEGQ